MPAWAVASVLYFTYVAALAVLRPVAAAARLHATTLSGIGALAAFSTVWVDAVWLRHFLLPLAVLLVGYWASGPLWTGPMPRMEQLLVRSDAALGIARLSQRVPRGLCELLELAYVGVYPLVPLAFGLHLAYAEPPDPDRFWTVILVTDFICFAMLPWIQTRPPRALEELAPWRSGVRSLNVKLLGETSIGANTVPSGHAAEAFAAALLVSGGPWPIVVTMWTAALAVSAGAVLGRYHFALDALAGWGVALAVWILFAG